MLYIENILRNHHLVEILSSVGHTNFLSFGHNVPEVTGIELMPWCLLLQDIQGKMQVD